MRASPHTLVREVMREPVRPPFQFAEADPFRAAHDGGAVRHGIDGVLEKIRDVVCHPVKLEHVIVLGNRTEECSPDRKAAEWLIPRRTPRTRCWNNEGTR
ncbi:hypothetical protein GCM10027521_33740 [Amycolatopsis cihanbeyliensis]